MNNYSNPRTPSPATNSGPPSLVASGSQSTTVFFTPGPNDNNREFVSFADLFLRAEYSPPAFSNRCPLQDVIEKANSILLRCSDNPAVPKLWEDLDEIHQVGLAFLIYKKQHELVLEQLNGDQAKAACQIMEKVLGLTNGSHSTLKSFIHQGGDNSHDGDGEHSNGWESYLDKHPEWRDNETAFTIFTHPGSNGHLVESPFVRDQDIASLVCYIISAAQVLLYYMILKTGSSLSDGIKSWGINVGRFMRNNLSNKQIFRTIFFQDGGYPDFILETLLEHVQTPHPDDHAKKTRKASIDYDSSKLVYEVVLHELKKRGPLLVKGLKSFPGYIDTSITEHSGDLKELGGHTTGHPVLHACVVTGVVLTGSDDVMGGVKFLMQDSLPGRPFVGIGLDLLRSMGIDDFEAIENDVYFPGTTDMHKLDNVPIHTSSGSPHSSKFPSTVFESESNGVSIEECLTESQDSGMKMSSTQAAATKLDYIGFTDFEKEGAEDIDFSTYIMHTSGKTR